MYKYVISLGFFCSVASELKRIDLRSMSGPFDWVISDLSGVLMLIQQRFTDFLNPQYLEQNKEYPYILTNQKYKIDFYHDFSPEEPLSEQIQSVTEKYTRRINRFYEAIRQPTLFIRYIHDQKEYDWLIQHDEEVVGLLKQFNKFNTILFVGNTDLEIRPLSTLNIYLVEKDKGDTVAREFLEKNSVLKAYLEGIKLLQSKNE